MTDQTERSEAKGKDLLGLFLSGVGGLFFVSILLSFGERAPKEVLWTAPVVGLIDAIGRGAALVASGAVAGFGTALFLGKRDFAIGRYLAGFAGITLGLSLLIGGVVPTGNEGGLLGSVLPDLIPGVAGRLVGAILGLGIVAASAYFTWLLPIATAAGSRSLAPSLEARGGSEGVSAAEAAALTPAAPPAAPPAADPVTPPSSPYPTDARLEGRIPRGTRPLDAGGVVPPPPAREERREPEEPVAEETWERVVPTRAEREQEARPPLGDAGPALVDVQPVETSASPLTPSWERTPAPVPAEPWEEPRVTPLSAEEGLVPPAVPEIEDAPPAVEPEADAEPVVEAVAEPVVEAVDEAESAEAEPVSPPEATAAGSTLPAWEQVGLFDDQPVVEAASATEEEVAEPSVEAVLEELEEEPQALEEDDEEGLFAEEEELEDEPVASDEGDEEEDEDEELVASDEDGEDEDEEEYEDEDEEEDEELVASDEDDEDEDEEEYEDEDEEEDEELVASDEDGEDEDEEEYEDEDEEEDEELVASDEDGEDEDEEEYEEGDEEEELVASGAEAKDAAEPEKVLEPTPAPAAEDPAPTAGPADFETLVHEAGCLVIEQNRVAVSMLQRSFQLDFDQACAVLDQLQERGLIGPYMGGRTRDILLTREEWSNQAPVA